MTTLTDDTFAAAIASGVTLVDFYADWCGPCQMMMPTITEIADTYAGKIEVYKVDVDTTTIGQTLGVMSIPTFKVFKDGTEVASVMGSVPKEKLTAALDAALAA